MFFIPFYYVCLSTTAYHLTLKLLIAQVRARSHLGPGPTHLGTASGLNWVDVRAPGLALTPKRATLFSIEELWFTDSS